jgi:hypothetical protein
MLLYDAGELLFNLCLGKPCVPIRLFMTAIGSVKIPVLPVKMPYEHIGEIPRSCIRLTKPMDIVMGDKTAVEVQKIIKLFGHFFHVAGLDYFPEAFHNRQSADRLFFQTPIQGWQS